MRASLLVLAFLFAGCGGDASGGAPSAAVCPGLAPTCYYEGWCNSPRFSAKCVGGSWDCGGNPYTTPCGFMGAGGSAGSGSGGKGGTSGGGSDKGGSGGPSGGSGGTSGGGAGGTGGQGGSSGTGGTGGTCGALDGTELVVPLAPPSSIRDVIVDGDDLFYALASPTPTVFHLVISTGVATTFLEGWQTAQLAVDATTVYALNESGSTVTVPRTGGNADLFPGTGTEMALAGSSIAFLQDPKTLAFFPTSGIGGPTLEALPTPAVGIAGGNGAIVWTNGAAFTPQGTCNQYLYTTSIGPADSGTTWWFQVAASPPSPFCDNVVSHLVAADGDRGCIVFGDTNAVLCEDLVYPGMNFTSAGPLDGVPRALRIAGNYAYAIATVGGADLMCSTLERAAIGNVPSTPETLAPVAMDATVLALSATHVYFPAADGLRRRPK